MKNISLLLFCTGLCCTQLPAQDAGVNRRKVIDLVLGQSHLRMNLSEHQTNTYAITPTDQNAAQGFRSSAAIPRYCLPKGAIVCRLEEYVQLHSPFKLNIGVGGE